MWATLRSVGTPYDIPLTKTSFVIGRNATSDHVVEGNPCVSSVHCVLSYDVITGCAFLADCSSNGCAVNSVRVGKGCSTPLLEGDLLDLVDCRSPKQEIYRLRYELRGVVVVAPPVVAPPKQHVAVLLLESFYAVSSICLGRGHYAEVWRAIRKSDNLPVAVKTITKKKIGGGGGECNNSLDREAVILKKVSHEAIVSILDVFETPDYIHIVIELCSGGDLFDHLQSLPGAGLDEVKARAYFVQIASAVAYLHRRGIVHRDIKPENVLLCGDDKSKVKVTDFGLAKVFSAMSQSGSLLTSVCGTPMYVAPEVVEPGRRDAPYTANVDVWSLGVVLWVMLTRRVPLQRVRDPLGRPTKRLDYNTPLDFSLPVFADSSEGCVDLLKGMLKVDPTARLDMEGVMAHPWMVMTTKKRERE